MKQWDFKEERHNQDFMRKGVSLVDFLNQQGSQGWEPIRFAEQRLSHQVLTDVIFKRERK